MNGALGHRISAAVERCFAEDDRLLAVYLLGSAVRDELRRESDIDLALMPKPGTSIPAIERFNVAGCLSVQLGRQVDLGELGSHNLVYAREAILTGERIYLRDAFAADLRAATLLGMYFRFNEEREEVLDAYRAG